jgi:23S rRNA pseudouridine1911/1915/1917 synthase
VSNLNVLYEDNHCLAVIKPGGLLIAGDKTGDETLLDQAKQYIKLKYNKPGDVFLGNVHRLDRPVSGIALLARTSKAAARLSEQFRNGTVEKIYHCWVNGVPGHTQQTLTDSLLKSSNRNTVKVVPAGTSGSKEAKLTYRLLQTQGKRSLLEVQLHTGRSHQIRVQLSSRGWPILGDVKYGGPRSGDRSIIALHARTLLFQHPTQKEPVFLDAPIPEHWADVFHLAGHSR